MHHIKLKEFLLALIVIILGFGALYVVSTTQQSSSDIRTKASNQTLIMVTGTVKEVKDNKKSFTLPIDQVDNATESFAQPLVSALQGSIWEVQLKEDGSDKQTQCFQGSQETTVPCSQIVLVGKKVQVHTAPGDIKIGKKELKARKIYDRSQLPETSTAPAPATSSPPTSTSSEACLDTVNRIKLEVRGPAEWIEKHTYVLKRKPEYEMGYEGRKYIYRLPNVNAPEWPENVELAKKLSAAIERNVGRRCTLAGYVFSQNWQGPEAYGYVVSDKSGQRPSLMFAIYSLYPPEN